MIFVKVVSFNEDEKFFLLFFLRLDKLFLKEIIIQSSHTEDYQNNK